VAGQAAPVPSKLSRWASPPSTLCSTQVQPLYQRRGRARTHASKASKGLRLRGLVRLESLPGTLGRSIGRRMGRSMSRGMGKAWAPPESKVMQAAVEQRAGAAAVHAGVKGRCNQLLAPPAATWGGRSGTCVLWRNLAATPCVVAQQKYPQVSTRAGTVQRPLEAAAPAPASWDLPARPPT
jgi:hypothetical protein